MKEYLNEVRMRPAYDHQLMKKQLITVILGGIVLGIISKWLDETPVNYLPMFFQVIDLGNFLSRMGIWLFIALTIAIKSQSAKTASLNVFSFFLSMIIAYYAYTIIIAGFYPRDYIIIWILFTLLSPILAYLSWYAVGNSKESIIISSLIFMMMTRQTFAFGFWYLDLMHITEGVVWLMTIVLLYQNPRQIIKVVGMGLILFFLSSQFNIFNGIL